MFPSKFAGGSVLFLWEQVATSAGTGVDASSSLLAYTGHIFVVNKDEIFDYNTSTDVVDGSDTLPGTGDGVSAVCDGTKVYLVNSSWAYDFTISTSTAASVNATGWETSSPGLSNKEIMLNESSGTTCWGVTVTAGNAMSSESRTYDVSTETENEYSFSGTGGTEQSPTYNADDGLVYQWQDPGGTWTQYTYDFSSPTTAISSSALTDNTGGGAVMGTGSSAFAVYLPGRNYWLFCRGNNEIWTKQTGTTLSLEVADTLATTNVKFVALGSDLYAFDYSGNVYKANFL